MSISDIEQLLIGDSAAMRRVRALIRKIAPSSIPVLIEGPTGSGKELVARALHTASGRSGAFVAFNVCAVADSMFEDALFGHVRGAFTGAVNDRLGYLAEANCGTIFLDEIGGLPAGLQAKLLRAIEMKDFRAVGSRMDSRSDFRLISATNERLADVAAQGGFRHDLLFRLRGIVIELPPLASRLEDLAQLAQLFASRWESHRLHNDRPRSLTADAIALLETHSWPGNVRELKAVVECAAALSEDPVISRDDVLRAGMLGVDGRRLPDGHRRSFVERTLLEVLDETGWKIEAAAEILGVHRATIYRRLERLGCDPRRGGVTPPCDLPGISLTSNRRSVSGGAP
jgi:two-component system NtrC family response regulator